MWIYCTISWIPWICQVLGLNHCNWIYILLLYLDGMITCISHRYSACPVYFSPPPIRCIIVHVGYQVLGFFTFNSTLFSSVWNFEAHCRIISIPGQYFVPLLRSEDNSSQPFIGTPWSPESSRCGVNVPPMSWSPRDPLMAVKACAGPMTPSKVISTCSVVLFMDNS